MEYLIAWILAIVGAVNGIVVSALLKPFRMWVIELSDFFGKMIQCPMCLGFWLGGLFSLLGNSPCNSLLLDMFLGSNVAWIGSLILDRYQFNEPTIKSPCKKEVLTG